MRHTLLTVSALFLLAVSPAFASCDDELTALDKRITADASTAVASSSAGQSVAARRTGEADTARRADVPVTDVAKGPASGGKEAQATQASGAGDKVIQAKATINAARVAKGKGDEAACLAEVAKGENAVELARGGRAFRLVKSLNFWAP